jgi:putative sugar O-methyltransferase
MGNHMIQGDDVEDQLYLLEQMVQDAEHAPEVYQPTNDHFFSQESLIRYFKDVGLKGFRSSGNEYLGAIGARDLHPIKAPINSVKALSPTDTEADKYLECLVLCEKYPEVSLLPFDVSLNDLCETAYRFTEMYGFCCNAKAIGGIEASLNGKPEHSFLIEGTPYTYEFLCHYCRYCFCCRFMDFDLVDTIVELGGGNGKQIEIIKKLHPHITYYVLDFPAQAYLTGQYLTSIFGETVIDYSQNRHQQEIVGKKGSVNILCNWQIESIKPNSNTFFWSVARDGDMGPAAVSNYLSYASKWSDTIYLHQSMAGKNQEDGMEKLPMEYFHDQLKDRYQLFFRAPMINPLKRDFTGEEIIWSGKYKAL